MKKNKYNVGDVVYCKSMHTSRAVKQVKRLNNGEYYYILDFRKYQAFAEDRLELVATAEECRKRLLEEFNRFN